MHVTVLAFHPHRILTNRICLVMSSCYVHYFNFAALVFWSHVHAPHVLQQALPDLTTPKPASSNGNQNDILVFDPVQRSQNNKIVKTFEEALVDGELKLMKAVTAAQKGMQCALGVESPGTMLENSIQSLAAAQDDAANVQAPSRYTRSLIKINQDL